MNDSNGASQLTSSYVLSQPAVAARDSRFTRWLTRLRPTIQSIGWRNSSIESDIPSDALFDTTSPSTDPEASVDDARVPPHHRPIFKLNALCVQALLYPIIVVIYLVTGAAIFTAIEHGEEGMARIKADNQIKIAISTFAGEYNLSETVVERILSNFTDLLCTNNHLQICNGSYEWTFIPSFYFAATVVTAIGEICNDN